MYASLEVNVIGGGWFYAPPPACLFEGCRARRLCAIYESSGAWRTVAARDQATGGANPVFSPPTFPYCGRLVFS